MYRKLSDGQRRRSSQPKRLSTCVPELENNKNASEIKKSLIPRITTVSSRSSSLENDYLRRSGRSTLGFSRSTSSERAAVEDSSKPPVLQARSNENLFTPKYGAKTPAAGARKTALSVQRTVRKDTRPLSDRGFQNAELAKVHEFLVTHKVVTPSELQDVRNPITFKLFVMIMNSVLGALFPGHSLTRSNYCELIPLLMRKLKYPGNITRSWLLTVHSPHTWPNVLGLISWLVDLLNSQMPDLQFIEDDWMDCERVNKLYVNIAETYIVWNEKETDYISEKEDQFFEDLVLDLKKMLCEHLKYAQQEVEVLSASFDTDEHAAVEKFKAMKVELDKKKNIGKSLKEKLQGMQCILERNKNEKNTLRCENESIKQHIAGIVCENHCHVEDVAKHQSEIVSSRNIVKLQDGHVTDIVNQCYSCDLTNARLQGKLDEVRLQRDALIRGCTSEYVNESKLHLVLKYGEEDKSKIIIEYCDRIKKTSQTVDDFLKDCFQKDKSYKIQMNDEEEKLKLCQRRICRAERELQQCEESAEKIEERATVQSHSRYIIEELSKEEEKVVTLDETLRSAKTSLSDLEEELKLLEETFKERKAKYIRILKRMGDELLNHARRCEEGLRDALA